MSARLSFAYALLIVTALPAGSAAQVATLTSDASVTQQKPTRNYGRDELLRVEAGVTTLIRFNPAVLGGMTGNRIGKVTLRLFVRDVQTAGDIAVWRATGAWTEETVTWNTAPASTAQLALVAIAATDAGKWIEVDATSLAREWLDGVSVNDGIAIATAGPARVTFDSKESTATSHEPTLDYTLTYATFADNAARLGGIAADGYARADDPRLSDARPPLPGGAGYVQNSPIAQAAQFNVTNGIVRGNLTVQGTLTANIGGNFIQNRTTEQPAASFNIGGNGTASGTLSGGTVNADQQFSIKGQRILSNAGVENTFAGGGAGLRNSADGGTFVGASAGIGNTTGRFNAFFGLAAGERNTTGPFNTFLGNGAGYSNENGGANVFVGGSAGGRNLSGWRNVFVGDRAGDDIGFRDFSLGVGNTTGSLNTFVGSNTGGIVDGSNNTLIGAAARGADHVQFGTAIGAGASVTTNNTVVIGRPVDTVRIPGVLALGVVDAGVQYNLGGQRLASASTALVSTYVGLNAGIANIGQFNSFFGTYAGSANTSGFGNAFFGDTAGQLNTVGIRNAYVGSGAGAGNTTGGYNAILGFHAGLHNTTGSYNVFIGDETGGANLTGQENTFVGNSAGGSNQTGHFNTYIGNLAGVAATGSLNTIVGNRAGEHTDSGQMNAFLGSGAGNANTTGSGNTLLGRRAAANSIDGSDNTVAGHQAGAGLIGGSSNTIVGAAADVSQPGLAFASAFGAGALVGTNNTVVLGRPADAVSIPGSLTSAGPISAASFSGDGAALTNLAADSVVGRIVREVNGLSDAVTLAAGANVTITPAGNTLTISASGGGSGVNPILNQNAAPQAAANFSIGGAGSAASFNALTHYEIGSQRVLSTVGVENTFTGEHAGEFTLYGQGPQNSFYGASAGAVNSYGGENAFFGAHAGMMNAVGSYNTFTGTLSGLFNKAGHWNAFFGWRAGVQNENGEANTFIGGRAGENVDSNYNTYVGYGAGFGGYGKGERNTAVGIGAGGSTVYGNDNTAIGSNADAGGGMNNATAIGANAAAFQSNSMVLGSIAGIRGATADTSVGIGTPEPAARLHVDRGDIFIGSPGQGIILKSPNGGTCALLTIANGSGALVTSVVPCPR